MKVSFRQIIKSYEKNSIHNSNKGNRFEILMKNYFKIEPKYNFEKIYLWKEFPFKNCFGKGQDVGIDLVAKTEFDEYWAIQCKCYGENFRIEKSDVDSFLTTSARAFYIKDFKTKFSKRLFVSTTNKWSSNAEESIKEQKPEVIRINLYDLESANVNWDEIQKGNLEKALNQKYEIRPHQEEAISKSVKYFLDHDRGKLIMACGTGKTFTSLKIAEKIANKNKIVLFLVPSIALLSQILREWTAHAENKINSICVCSDINVSKVIEDIDISKIDLGYPATTNAKKIFDNFEKYKSQSKDRIIVIFSTYQSINTISEAQMIGLPEFDLIICDEAHRTTGAKLKNEDESSFSKVHFNNFIKGIKRLYMTATPRIYDENSKSKAKQNKIILCSMDNPQIYGEQIYRIGFGKAVDKGLLSDYKVLVLAIKEKDVLPYDLKQMIEIYYEKEENKAEIQTDDVAKIIGCINALSKNLVNENKELISSDIEPMKRAVAFCENIKASKIIKDKFNLFSKIYKEYLDKNKDSGISISEISCNHVDGTMSSPIREELLAKLKNQNEISKCHILSNVRCLSEGVDVPALDAVLFLSPRNSQIEVTQSVGRAMRKADGKKYGYIIIPVVVPDNITPEDSLDDNNRYKVVWKLLNALRSHDDRLTDSIIKEIQLNMQKPPNIDVVGIKAPILGRNNSNVEQIKLDLENLTKLQKAFYAKLVKKVGTKTYWESWAKDAAEIAEKFIKKLKKRLNNNDYKEIFYEFLDGIKKNVNSGITEKEAIEMLAQHIITEPVFQALFDDYSFIENNPISIAMRRTLENLKANAKDMFDERDSHFEEFYESVKRRTSGIKTAEGRQKVIIDLYDNFFKMAFPKISKQLGIVYTPVEIVDFIIHSVDDILKQEFGRNISDKNINIIDSFTGTGTFIVRLIQSGLINKKDLKRKYQNEIFANEIVLLAYYIATINIENSFKCTMKSDYYLPFEGICLTDTFQSAENDDYKSSFFPVNSERIEREKESPITIFIGNPPYSVGQKNSNDNAQNKKYPKLYLSIKNTYIKNGTSTNMNSVYDSYFKAFRYSTDRLGNNDGIICYVSNGNWLDSNAADGFRKTIESEFSKIYIFNLRGSYRKGKFEGDNVFGNNCSLTITITLLIKRKNYNQKAKIFYIDIKNMGYKLKCKEKLQKIKELKSFINSEIDKKILKPKENGDWIVERNDKFLEFIPLNPDKKFDEMSNSFFITYSNGIQSTRDAWVYNFSKEKLTKNIKNMIEFYNSQIDDYAKELKNNPNLKVKDFKNNDNTKISWSLYLENKLNKLKKIGFFDKNLYISSYRPFIKENLYFDKNCINATSKNHKLFPKQEIENLLICVSGIGVLNDFTLLITNKITDYEIVGKTQCFPLHYFEKNEINQINFGQNYKETYIKRDGISNFILKSSREKYDNNKIEKSDIFFYVYGFLHSPNYRKTFAQDLKRSLPKIPLVEKSEDFWEFSKAGKELSKLHLNYETIESNKKVKIIGDNGNYEIKKMKFISKQDKSKIIFNNEITIKNIPLEAYDYILNGKSAIEWVMDRYQIKTDKNSKIINDPNDWTKEKGNPRYILDLLLSIIEVSIRTMEIVKNLPKINF